MAIVVANKIINVTIVVVNLLPIILQKGKLLSI